MESNELRFRHVGLSSDGAVIFCEMDNGKTYAMPLGALEQSEDWNPEYCVFDLDEHSSAKSWGPGLGCPQPPTHRLRSPLLNLTQELRKGLVEDQHRLE